MKSIIEETGVEAIDTQDDGIVSLNSLSSMVLMINATSFLRL